MERVELFLVVKIVVEKDSDFNGPDIVNLVQGCIDVGFEGSESRGISGVKKIEVLDGFCDGIGPS